MGEIKNIKLNKILNHNENPRHEVANSQNDTLKKLFHTVGFQNMLNLAEDIKNNGLVGSQKITVVYADEVKKYIVYDGNRRVAALKLLYDRESFDFLDSASVNRIKKIVKEFSAQDSVECYVTDEEDAFFIMERLHSGEDSGRGVKQWSSREKELFKTRRNGIKNTAYLIDYYARKYFSQFDITTILPFTTVQRIFDKKKVKTEIGLDTNDELTFTPERVQLVIDASKWIVEKSKQEELAVTRVFNTVRNIEDLLLPWIKAYKMGACFTPNENSLKVSNVALVGTPNSEKKLIDPSVLIENKLETKNIIPENSRLIEDDISTTSSTNILTDDSILSSEISISDHDIDNNRGSGGKGNLPYFFQGLRYGHLSPNDSDTHGVSAICRELQLFSDKKMVKEYPIAAAFLTRAIIEQSIKHYSKKTLIQGSNKFIWDQVGQNDKLSKIIDNYKKSLPNFITDAEYRSYFTSLFANYDDTVEPLNWVVHRPEKFRMAHEKLIELPRAGLLSLVNYFLSE